jgi:hypothetical protein
MMHGVIQSLPGVSSDIQVGNHNIISLHMPHLFSAAECFRCAHSVCGLLPTMQHAFRQHHRQPGCQLFHPGSSSSQHLQDERPGGRAFAGEPCHETEGGDVFVVENGHICMVAALSACVYLRCQGDCRTATRKESQGGSVHTGHFVMMGMYSLADVPLRSML